jgi:hypothetical protein
VVRWGNFLARWGILWHVGRFCMDFSIWARPAPPPPRGGKRFESPDPRHRFFSRPSRPAPDGRYAPTQPPFRKAAQLRRPCEPVTARIDSPTPSFPADDGVWRIGLPLGSVGGSPSIGPPSNLRWLGLTPGGTDGATRETSRLFDARWGSAEAACRRRGSGQTSTGSGQGPRPGPGPGPGTDRTRIEDATSSQTGHAACPAR